MKTPYLLSSVSRISPLDEAPCTVRPLERSLWAMGNHVVAEVDDPDGADPTIELCNGRMIEATQGDLVVGAFGKCYATLEATGDWERIGPDGRLHALTEGGCSELA
jgi:hypothetical protein